MSGVLLKAVSAGRPRQVRLLLDSGITLETKDECGQTPLIRSIFIEHPRNRERVVRLLLKYCARVSDSDIVGRNSLSWACLYALDKEVRVLLEEADVNLNLNQQDANGQTCLYHAATSGSASVVKMVVDALRKYDMSVELPNKKGVTPLIQAIKLGHDVCAAILIYQGQATVGLSMKTSNDDVTYAEMWANQRKANMSIHGEAHATGFLPSLNSFCLRTIKIRENEAAQRTEIPAYYESPDEDLDRDSNYGSEVSYMTDESERRMNRAPRRPDTPLSMHTISVMSSTEACADSESEDEIDAFSSPLTPHQRSLFIPSKQLHAMYSIYEEQNTSSFRPTAAKSLKREIHASIVVTFESSPRVIVSPIPPAITGDLRKFIARKQLPHTKLKQLTGQSKFATALHLISSSSESESEKFFVPRKKAMLPKLFPGAKTMPRKKSVPRLDKDSYSQN